LFIALFSTILRTEVLHTSGLILVLSSRFLWTRSFATLT
jgi:hypothetical protein